MTRNPVNMSRVLLVSLLLGAVTTKPNVPAVQTEGTPVVQYSANDSGVTDLGQDDTDYVLSADTARGFPSTGGLDDDGSYYEDDSEYAYDQSEAKLFALTKDLGGLASSFGEFKLPSINVDMPYYNPLSKASFTVNDTTVGTLSTIGNIGLLLGGIYLIGNSITGNKAAVSSRKSDKDANEWRKYLTRQPPTFHNIMEKQSLTQLNKRMGLTYVKAKPGRKIHHKKPVDGAYMAKHKARPVKSKFVRKSNESKFDKYQERKSSGPVERRPPSSSPVDRKLTRPSSGQVDRQSVRPSSGQVDRQTGRPSSGQIDRQTGRPVPGFAPQFRPRIPTIPTLRLRMPTVTLPNLRLNRPNLSNIRQSIRNMVPSLAPLNRPSLRPQAPLVFRRPPQLTRRPPPAPVAQPQAPPADSTSSRPAPLTASTPAASPQALPVLPASTSIRPEPVQEDSTFRNQANPLLPEPIEFNSIFSANSDPFAEFQDDDFGDSASFRELLDAQFGDFQFNKIKRKDD